MFIIDCAFPQASVAERQVALPPVLSITGAGPCTFLIEIVTARTGSSVATILSISVACLKSRRAKLSVTGFQACSPKSKRSKSILARQSNWIKFLARARRAGVRYAYEEGLAGRFDRVNHDKLMGQIAKRVEDKRLLKLIRAFLNAGVMENGLVSPSVEGTPQGGPLSPLLSNLVLDELDRELEHRGHRFVRYADDCNVYVRSERAGRRVMESISRFITQKLKLKVNEAKSAVARPQERKFLGFSFTAGPGIKRTIAPKSLERFKRRIREITRRAKGVSIKTTMEELATYMRGWRGYFGFCETPEVLIALTRWVRLRLRAALWRQWKTPRRRRAALIANGVSGWAARNTAGSGRGPWYLARSRALSTGLSNAYFKSLGLPSLFQSC